ncbi:MFS family permease [Caulobacter ginsengisoli]|uniref:MFS family permease n=1 Tax=Caulobacter ginsengisoli TaxID=400775 RepID=A0ABU0IKC0_9CAUL|nr:MFS transporter [Caulobacter ginsengisoli]MDQ0462456.1 MFS family permease [Caulobacter ginsengisoli]
MTEAIVPEPPVAAASPSVTDALHPISTAYRRYALTLLVVVYSLNFLDRQIVNILAESIKEELHLQDWQIGMMQGLAFAIFYTTLGIPIARLAERGNRPWIIGTAIAAWSGFTMLCGLSTNFIQLVLARIGVSIGEAGCSPPSHSLIADYTPREKRSSALAIYSLGTPIGSLLGMALGGVIADLWGWRAAFLIAGAPGIVVALIAAFTLIEPRNRLKADLAARQAAGPSIMDAVRELSTKKTFWLMAFAASLLAFQGYASNAFIGSFYFRNHTAELAGLAADFGMKPKGFLGLALGLIGGTAGVFGTWFGGMLADRLGRRDLRWHVTMPAIATSIAIPFYILGIMHPSGTAALFLLTIPTLCNTMWYGPIYGSVQSLVKPETRTTAAALILFIINIIGLGGGPTFLGWLSDFMAKTGGLGVAEGLRAAMIINAFTLLGSVGLFLWARRTIREEMVS